MKHKLWCSRLTSLDLSMGKESCETDEYVVALVQALPQLRELHLDKYAVSATNAGRQCIRCSACCGCVCYDEHSVGPAESPTKLATTRVMPRLYTM